MVAAAALAHFAHGADHASEGGDGMLFTLTLVGTIVVLGVVSMVRSRRRERSAAPDVDADH